MGYGVVSLDVQGIENLLVVSLNLSAQSWGVAKKNTGSDKNSIITGLNSVQLDWSLERRMPDLFQKRRA